MRLIAARLVALILIVVGFGIGCKERAAKEPNALEQLRAEELSTFLERVGGADRIEMEVMGEIRKQDPDTSRIGPIVVTDRDTIKRIADEIGRVGNISPNKHPFQHSMSGPDARLTVVRGDPYLLEYLIVDGAFVTFLESQAYKGHAPDEALRFFLYDLARQHADNHPEDVIAF